METTRASMNQLFKDLESLKQFRHVEEGIEESKLSEVKILLIFAFENF